jgi:4-hydroxybenzoate polyprenyltransferase
LVVVRVLVGDGDDVLFSSFFLALHFSLALFFALHATSGLSSHTMLPVLLTTNRFFFRCSSFSPQKDQRQRQKKCNNNLFSFIIIIIIIISLLQAYDTSI